MGLARMGLVRADRGGIRGVPPSHLSDVADMVAAMQTALTFSDDQAEAWDRVAAELLDNGIDLVEATLTPRIEARAPGFGDLVMERRVLGPHELEARDAALVVAAAVDRRRPGVEVLAAPPLVVGVVTDRDVRGEPLVDEVEQRTAALAHSEARQRLLMESAPVALAMFDELVATASIMAERG